MERIQVIADDRERYSGALEELQASPRFNLTIKRLPAGDYLVDGRFLFERKTLPDLVASITSGRLFSQTLRLAQVNGVRAGLILEGASQSLQGCGMRWAVEEGRAVYEAEIAVSPAARSFLIGC